MEVLQSWSQLETLQRATYRAVRRREDEGVPMREHDEHCEGEHEQSVLTLALLSMPIRRVQCHKNLFAWERGHSSSLLRDAGPTEG